MNTNDLQKEVQTSDAILPTGKLPGPILDRLITTYRTRMDPSVIISPGYGRDAAAVRLDAANDLIVKSDPITFATDGAARYLIAVNANDVACLGGIPRWLTVVALLPEGSTTETLVERLFADLQDACDAFGISIIGGHTEITSGVDHPLLIGTMLGTPGPQGLIHPGNARINDDLLLTKWIGIEGTALLARERGRALERAVGKGLVARAAKLLRHPGISIVADVRAALALPGVTALHDPTEGGIATAVHELARGSGCGAEILADAIPILPETRLICDHLGLDALGLLSSGALLMAVSPHRRDEIEGACREAGVTVTHIGKLVPPEDGLTLIQDGERHFLPRFDSDEIARVLQDDQVILQQETP